METVSKARRLARWVSEAWNAAGLTLLAFSILELTYVGQRAVRTRISGSDAVREASEPGHPFAGQSWFVDFLTARDRTQEKYDPWRGYWAYPSASRYLNVDSAGERVTVQPPTLDSGRRTVFMLGGSAMWGYTARDSATIPSLVSAALRQAGVTNVELRNLAQPGYTVTHEFATLLHEINRGRTPALAIFLTGINDIRTTQHAQEPGHVFFEQRFRHLYERESPRGFFSSFITPGERSRLIQRLLIAIGAPNEWAVPPRQPGTCERLGAYVKSVHDNAVAVAAERGLGVLFVQQPIHATTKKPVTPFEQTFMGPPHMLTYTRDCATAIDTALSSATGSTYLSFAGLFDQVAETVFLDRYAHVTEDGNRRIAEALAKEILARLSR